MLSGEPELADWNAGGSLLKRRPACNVLRCDIVNNSHFYQQLSEGCSNEIVTITRVAQIRPIAAGST
jgi:hypothetical protein